MMTKYKIDSPQQRQQCLLPLAFCGRDCEVLRRHNRFPPRQFVIHVGGSHKTNVHQNRAGYKMIIPSATSMINESWFVLTAGGNVAVGGDGDPVLLKSIAPLNELEFKGDFYQHIPPMSRAIPGIEATTRKIYVA